MTQYEKYEALDRAVTDYLEENFGTFSVLVAQGNNLYLAVQKRGNTLPQEALEHIEQTYCETLGLKTDTKTEVLYFLGMCEPKYRLHGTDYLVNYVEHGLTIDEDMDMATVLEFLADNPEYKMQSVDGKVIIGR